MGALCQPGNRILRSKAIQRIEFSGYKGYIWYLQMESVKVIVFSVKKIFSSVVILISVSWGLQSETEDTEADYKYLIAKSFFKSMVELVLPPIRYRKLGFFNFFATYSNPSIFAGVLFLNNYDEILDINQKESLSNIGFQIDTKLVMFSHLSATLSFGCAQAFDNNVDNIMLNSYNNIKGKTTKI